MKSTAHINGHPIHPMLIPYPFALLTSATVFDIGAKINGRRSWAETASHLTSAGLASALVAALPGIVDYFGTVPPRSDARRSATQHALCNVSALLCFGLAHSRRQEGERLPGGGVALSLIGTGLLSIGGWLGGQLVYHERIAVVETPTAGDRAPRIGTDATRISADRAAPTADRETRITADHPDPGVLR